MVDLSDRHPVDILLETIDRMDLVDLTHPLEANVPVWPGHPHFCQEVRSSLELGDVSCWHAVSMGEHTGTHFDAPSHFIRKGWSISEAQLGRFFGRMVTIDAQEMEARAVVDPEKILAWEAGHGLPQPRSAIAFRAPSRRKA